MSLSESFTSSARRYDLLTRLNPGYQRELRHAARKLASLLDESVGRHPRIWDLGCGSGLSTQALLAEIPGARVLGIDSSAGMLDYARAKTWPPETRFLLERVENLDRNRATELTEQPDAVFAAYLLRNVSTEDRTKVLRTVQARMKPGTPLVLQDYSVSESRGAKLKWSAVCFLIIVPLSTMVGAKTGLFTYLWRSVMNNDSTQTVVRRFRDAGLTNTSVGPARGWHRRILHTYAATKPGEQA